MFQYLYMFEFRMLQLKIPISIPISISISCSECALLFLQVLMKVLSNIEACVLVRGCVLAVDLLTVAHEASERTSIPLQSNLIAATAFMEPLKEWMFIDKDGIQVGPLEKDAIRRFWSKKTIDWTTGCWASGMLDWKRLHDIREFIGHFPFAFLFSLQLRLC